MSWRQSRFISGTGCGDMLLTLPDIRQTNNHDCGEAAVRCVLGFHGIKAAVSLATEPHGTDPVQIESALRKIGMQVTAGEMSIDDLKHYCDTGRPVIALVHWPEGKDSHWIVVRGVSRSWVYYHDVESGSAKIKSADFDACWQADGRMCSFRRWGITPWLK